MIRPDEATKPPLSQAKKGFYLGVSIWGAAFADWPWAWVKWMNAVLIGWWLFQIFCRPASRQIGS